MKGLRRAGHLGPIRPTPFARLKGASLRIITIANFSPKMLQSNAESAGLTEFFETLLSIHANHF
jgi:hypothetical protein